MPRGGFGLRGRDDFCDVGLGLIIFDDSASPAKIIAHQMPDQLHKGLAIAQDLRFQGVGQNRVGNNQHQDRRHPPGEQNGDDDVEALKAATLSFLESR